MKDNCYKDYKNELHFELPIGYTPGNEFTKSIELMKTNGVAEEVFLRKLSEKPYTWIGNVISISTAKIGSVSVGMAVREEYLKSGTVSIPQAVLKMPLAEANTMLVEVHRRVWQNLIPRQEIICKYCTKKLVADIDLNRIEMRESSLRLLEENGDQPIEFIVVDLPSGFTVNDWLVEMKKDASFENLKDKNFNRIILRLPTLGDAIRNEKLATSDNIKFWRQMAKDCIVKIQSIVNNEVVEDFPTDQLIFLSSKLFDRYLDNNDLKALRTASREELPTMPFDYTDTCPCDRQREIPFSMEATSFFSE